MRTLADPRPPANVSRTRADRVLFERYQRGGDQRQRDELVERFMPLARKMARHYSRDVQSLDDLTQVAAVGLIKAVDRFDPDRGVAFSSYALPTITGELKRYFRDRTWAVRPPRDLLERALRTEAATARFTAEHNRPPTVTELTERLDGLDEEDVLEALHARRAATATSLQTPLGGDDGEHVLGDRLGSDDEGYTIAEQRVLLEGLLSVLPLRSRAILRMRFVDDLTQAEIGTAVGISQMQVSRILRQSLERLQSVARPEGHAEPAAGA